MNWQNRIIGFEMVDPEQLLANTYNWRVHGTEQQEAITGVLDSIGWVGAVLVNHRTGRMIDGHMRVRLAIRKNEPLVPVLFVDLSENEEMQVLATLDPIGNMATTDRAMLDEVLREVGTTDAGVQQFLADLAEKEKLYKLPPKEKSSPDPKLTEKDVDHDFPDRKHGVMIVVESREQQDDLLAEFEDRGFNCKRVSAS